MILNAEEQVEDNHDSNSKMLSRLDGLPFGRWHLFVALSLGLVWIFDGYEVTLISLYRNEIEADTSEKLFKGLVTAYQVGCIVGSIFFGTMAFIIGRRKIFLITLIIYFFGVMLSGLSTPPLVFLASRFLTGLSVGGQFTAIFSAVDQFLPPSYRGRVNIAIDGTWHLGGTIASLLTMLVGETTHWRLMFLFGWIGIISLFGMRRNVPESPRWLLLKNRKNEAAVTIAAIEEAVNNQNCMLSPMREEDSAEPKEIQGYKSFCDYLKQIGVLLWQALTQHTRKFLVGFGLIFTQAIFFNMIYYQYPDILANHYNLNQSQISAYMLPLSIMSFISTLIVGRFFDTIGRRFMILLTYGITGVLLLISYSVEPLLIKEVLIVTMFLFASPAGSSANLICSEIFPTASRTIVLFIMFVVSMLGGMVGVWFDNHIVGGILMITMGVLGFFFCPNSQNKTLEEIESL